MCFVKGPFFFAAALSILWTYWGKRKFVAYSTVSGSAYLESSTTVIVIVQM